MMIAEMELSRRAALVTAAALVAGASPATAASMDAKVRSLAKEYSGTQNTNGAPEKHIPVIEVVDGGTSKAVTVTIPHVMDPVKPHFIEYVWLADSGTGKIVASQKYQASDAAPPTLTTNVPSNSKVTPMCFCNLHGLWEGPTVSV